MNQDQEETVQGEDDDNLTDSHLSAASYSGRHGMQQYASDPEQVLHSRDYRNYEGTLSAKPGYGASGRRQYASDSSQVPQQLVRRYGEGAHKRHVRSGLQLSTMRGTVTPGSNSRTYESGSASEEDDDVGMKLDAARRENLRQEQQNDRRQVPVDAAHEPRPTIDRVGRNQDEYQRRRSGGHVASDAPRNRDTCYYAGFMIERELLDMFLQSFESRERYIEDLQRELKFFRSRVY